MKVLVFTTLYPNNIFPNHGIFIKERISNLAYHKNCEVKVVAPVPYYPPVKIGWRQAFAQIPGHEIIEGIEVYHPKYLMTPKVGMIFYGLLMFLSSLSCVARIRRRFNFDLIDAHYVYPDGFAAALTAKFFKVPLIISARGSDINRYARMLSIRKFLRYALIKADQLICVSKALKMEIIRLQVPEEKITVIPNGVDLGKFKSISKTAARKNLGLPDQKKIILYVGRLDENKGVDLLIRSLKIINGETKEKDVHLIIVGNGQTRKKLESLTHSLNLSRQVLFMGTVPHNELYQWYSAADVFCLPSKMEGWPNVIMEAMACGVPVVATPVGGIPEIITSDKVGLLAQRNIVKISKTLTIALQLPWNSDQIKKHAEQYTWVAAANAVFNIFEFALERYDNH